MPARAWNKRESLLGGDDLWSPKSVVYKVGEVYKQASNPFSFMGETCSPNIPIISFIKMKKQEYMQQQTED